MTKYSIQTTKLCKKFGDIRAVESVDLAVPAGSIYAFLGPNGAGKTTTIRLILGLIRKDEGSIQIFGEDADSRRKAHSWRIGSLVEGPALYPHLNADEMLGMAAGMLSIEKPKQRIDEVLSLLNLQKPRKRLIKTWSLGMKQRLGLALALLSKPELLILDEPTNGLDPSGIQEMRALLRQFPEQFGMTVFLSSHLLDEVNRVATDVGIIKEGRLIFQGSLDELQRKSPQGLFVRSSDNTQITTLMSKQGIESLAFDNGLLFPEVLDDAGAARINNAVAAAGIDIYHLAQFRADMEDLFNKLTGNGEKTA